MAFAPTAFYGAPTVTGFPYGVAPTAVSGYPYGAAPAPTVYGGYGGFPWGGPVAQQVPGFIDFKDPTKIPSEASVAAQLKTHPELVAQQASRISLGAPRVTVPSAQPEVPFTVQAANLNPGVEQWILETATRQRVHPSDLLRRIGQNPSYLTQLTSNPVRNNFNNDELLRQLAPYLSVPNYFGVPPARTPQGHVRAAQRGW